MKAALALFVRAACMPGSKTTLVSHKENPQRQQGSGTIMLSAQDNQIGLKQ
jgi:hypothetical protein